VDIKPSSTVNKSESLITTMGNICENSVVSDSSPKVDCAEIPNEVQVTILEICPGNISCYINFYITYAL